MSMQAIRSVIKVEDLINVRDLTNVGGFTNNITYFLDDPLTKLFIHLQYD